MLGLSSCPHNSFWLVEDEDSFRESVDGAGFRSAVAAVIVVPSSSVSQARIIE